MIERDLLKVTCKVALYNLDKSLVLLVEYGDKGYGLPGGHLGEAEIPEVAVKRELQEELGIEYEGSLTHGDFWRHPDGKIILGFYGQLDHNTLLMAEQGEISHAKWVPILGIQQHKVSAGTYDDFILRGASRS